jgi:uncharacterized membrane protein YuzA (DUF378 family)
VTRRPELPAISDGWAEGRYFDAWMAVHALSGFAGGLSNVFFGLTPTRAYLLALALMILWELGEVWAGIRESLSNRVLDIVVGLAGVWCALRLLGVLTPSLGRVAFALAFVASVIGTMMGARAYRRRSRRQP